MVKIYYNKDGYVCNRYPYDFNIDDENRYIEVEEEVANQTLVCGIGNAWKVEKGKLIEVVYDSRLSEETKINEQIKLLENWFNDTYTYKEQKYRRLVALNKADDDGVDGATKLLDLYNEAEEKRLQIQELEKGILNNF